MQQSKWCTIAVTVNGYQYLSLKYQYQYQYPCLKYKYKYQYFSSKYQYQYKYLKMVLKYRSSTSTSTQYYNPGDNSRICLYFANKDGEMIAARRCTARSVNAAFSR